MFSISWSMEHTQVINFKLFNKYSVFCVRKAVKVNYYSYADDDPAYCKC